MKERVLVDSASNAAVWRNRNIGIAALAGA
jgi:hypothetical protein